MRIAGHNWLAILVAALVIYAIEYAIYGLMVRPMDFVVMAGMETIPEAERAALGWRIALGFIMPLLASIGLSLTIKWRGQLGMMAGAMTGLLMGVLFGWAGRLYGFVYGPDTPVYLAIDLVRLPFTYFIAGAILGAWK